MPSSNIRSVEQLMQCATLDPEPFISATEAVTLMPGMTKNHLAQLRFDGTGPRFYKPTSRTVFYKASDVLAWLNKSARISTSKVAA